MNIYMIYLRYKKTSFHGEELFPLALFETKPSAYHFLYNFNRALWTQQRKWLGGTVGLTTAKDLSTLFPVIAEGKWPSINRFDDLVGFQILGSAMLDECEVAP